MPLFGTVNRSLQDWHKKWSWADGSAVEIHKATASKKKNGARTHPTTGIQSRQLPPKKRAKPISPRPIIFWVLALPHFGQGSQLADGSRVGMAAPQ